MYGPCSVPSLGAPNAFGLLFTPAAPQRPVLDLVIETTFFSSSPCPPSGLVAALEFWEERERREGGRSICLNGTNLQNKGLISADRGTRATLTLTIPRSLFKSYAKDLSFPIFELVFQHRPVRPVVAHRCRYNIMIWGQPEDWPVLTHDNIGESNVSPLFSMDSGLEAFSRNPTRGSFAALTFQSTALPITRTNGSSRTKLDYCRGDDFISRVKLTCLTTV
jgi:hypothetical protein